MADGSGFAALIRPADFALPPAYIDLIRAGSDAAGRIMQSYVQEQSGAFAQMAASMVPTLHADLSRLAAVLAEPVERRPSGLVVPRRRGPRRMSDQEWLTVTAEALAQHCQDTGDDPFDCDYRCLAAATMRAPETLARAASQRGVRLARIQAEAWALQGRPGLGSTGNFVHPDVWLRRSQGA